MFSIKSSKDDDSDFQNSTTEEKNGLIYQVVPILVT